MDGARNRRDLDVERGGELDIDMDNTDPKIEGVADADAHSAVSHE